MSNYISSIISLYENAKSAKEGNILRHASVVGHASKVITKLANVDCGAGRVCKNLVDTFETAAKGSKALQILKKGVKLTRYTDPISATCAMIRVAKSDTPGRSMIEESGSLLGMFAVEGAMIKYAKDIGNIKGIKSINDKMVDFCKKTKGLGQLPAVVYGVLFTVGSIVGTSIAKKASTWVADKLGLPQSKETGPQNRTADGKKKYYFG